MSNVKQINDPQLSIRARNALFRLGIETKEQAFNAIAFGRLHPSLHDCKNYGDKTHSEVCRWCGHPEPSTMKFAQLCPHCGKTHKSNLIKV